MNVASLRQRIERALKYAPDVRAHRDDILQRLNDSLLELTLSVAWPFRVRTFGIRALGPVKVQAADYTRPDAQTFQFAVPSEWELPDRDELEGHTLALLDATDNVLGEWVIEEATYAAGNVNVTLDPRFLDYTPTGTEIVELRFYRYRLPPDAQEILGFMARRDERGHVEMVTLAMEADLVLNQDESPGEITAALPDSARLANRRNPGDTYPQDELEPPHTAPTLALAAGGTLEVGATYEYRYAHVYAGLVSDPSPSTSIQITAGNQTVNLSDMDSWGVATYGRRKFVFRRKGEGVWYRIGQVTDPTLGTFTDDGSFAPGASATATTREYEWLANGLNRWVRFWPRSASNEQIECRYLAAPARLDDDADVPQGPELLHQAMVHMVVRDIAAQADADRLMRFHDGRLEQVLATLRRRYITDDAVRAVKQSVFASQSRRLALGPVIWNG